jgi:nucleoside-diphosphate-sugar epimerase
MRILITGGAGYLGSTLTSLLLEGGHEVRVLDSLLHGGGSLLASWSHPGYAFLRGDIRDPKTLARAVEGMDAVVHLAAIVGDPACARDPERCRQVNVDASGELLALSQAASVERFVFVSTCSNYGRMDDAEIIVDETTELRPLSVYAESKVEVEKLILGPIDDAMFCPTVLRFATLHGVSPRMRFDLTVNEFTMELIVAGRLAVYGRQFWRPYLHVRDASRAIQLILNSDQNTVGGQVFNVGDTEQNFRKGELVEIARAKAPESVVDYIEKDEDPRDYRVSFEKIHSKLGFSITRSVQDGVDEVAALVRSGAITDFSDSSYRN